MSNAALSDDKPLSKNRFITLPQKVLGSFIIVVGTIYFTFSPAIYEPIGDFGCTLKEKEIQELDFSTGNIATVDVEGDYLYYISFQNRYIYKIKSDGTNKTLLNAGKSANLDVYDGWVYFVNLEDRMLINRIKTNGSKKENVTGTKNGGSGAYILKVDNEWIYFINLNGKERIYKIMVDGKNMIKIGSQICSKTLVMQLEDDWIYYLAHELSTSKDYIYKVKTNGAHEKRISEDDCIDMDYFNGKLYYSTLEGIYRINVDGTDKFKLVECEGNRINVYKDYVYYEM